MGGRSCVVRCALLVALLGPVATGCTRRPDMAALEARHPALAGEETARLADATPYLLPSRDELVAFFCRWDGARPVEVSLPPDATPRERALLERALQAWQRADLGLLFEIANGPRADIEIRFVEKPAGPAGSTGADCLVEGAPGEGATALDARLVHASIHLRRGGEDALGGEAGFSEAELLGSAVHELGHALGYQGHSKRGDAVMVRSVDRVRRTGRELLDGAPLRDDALHALYALPSGAILRRAALPQGRTSEIDRIAAYVAEGGGVGPLVRVGDTAARIRWRARDGARLGFAIRGVGDVLRDPATLVLEPDVSVVELLAAQP